MLCVTLAIGAFAGCSKSSTKSSSSTSLAVSGTISTSANPNAHFATGRGFGPHMLVEGSVQAMDLTSYTVVCVTTTVPPVVGTGSISASGVFSLSIAGGVNQPLACGLVDSNGNKLADFIINDTDHVDMNGNAQTSTTATYAASADFGAITYNPDSGEVVVPVANISGALSSSTASSSSLFDPTGAWTIGAVDFTLPPGVHVLCANGQHNNCDGPPEGQELYFKLFQGTQNSSNVYGLQLWESPSNFNACGGVVGLSTNDQNTIGVDFSGLGTAVNSAFTFPTSVTGFVDTLGNTNAVVNLTNGWEMSTAKSQYQINPDCSPSDVTIGSTTYSNAWVCGADSANHYQINIGGGCVDSSGNPVQVTDWSGVVCGTTSTDPDGIKSQSCPGTATVNGTPTSVTCSNTWAVATKSGNVYTVGSGLNFNWNDLNADNIAAQTSCSAIANGASSNALKIAQLQCYANYYQQSGFNNASACLPQIDMNWSAKLAADFVNVDTKRPSGLVFFEQYKPFPDGTGGSMTTRQNHWQGVQLKGNQWVNCNVIDTGTISLKKVSDTRIMAVYQHSEITTSRAQPACLANFTGSKETYLFYLNK